MTFKSGLILVLTLFFVECAHVKYQRAVAKEFPDAKVYNIQNSDLDPGLERYVVVTKDSSVYFVECGSAFKTKPTTKQFLFSLKK